MFLLFVYVTPVLPLSLSATLSQSRGFVTSFFIYKYFLLFFSQQRLYTKTKVTLFRNNGYTYIFMRHARPIRRERESESESESESEWFIEKGRGPMSIVVTNTVKQL